MKHRLFTRITAGLCFAVLILGLRYESCCRALEKTLCGNVLRLHVIASSDNDGDIAVKNRLANRMKPIIDELFGNCISFEDALDTAKENEQFIMCTAKKMLEDMGCSDEVSISISPFEYNTRILDGCIYPAGEYCSVRIVIGEGKGQNWWCVLFSPLTDTGIEYDASEKSGCKIRFKFLEWFR